MTAAATGPHSSSSQASSTSGSISDPGSHGLVAALLSPSGATAYVTRPRAMPAPVPTASVAGATRDRREVIQRMGATYSAVRIRERAAPSHGLGAAGLATSRYT